MENYRLGKRPVSHRKRRIVLLFVVVILVVAGVIAAKNYFKAGTTIGAPPAPVVTSVIDANAPNKLFDEGSFTIKLPSDWKFVSHQTAGYNIYSWHNTKTNPGVEQLQIYLDTIPTSLGVNRVLPVQANGNQLVPTTVSDNCSTFTGNKVPGPPSTPAKWEGVNFLCDLGNYERDVVGTSSTNGINVVKLVGPTTGAHNLFFAYTDNGPTPDFTIFTSVLQTFRLK